MGGEEPLSVLSSWMSHAEKAFEDNPFEFFKRKNVFLIQSRNHLLLVLPGPVVCVNMTPFEDTREKPSDIEGGAMGMREELCRLAGRPAQGKSHIIYLERCRRFVPVIAVRGFLGLHFIWLKFIIIIFFFKFF
jgi:hypothetical protein